MGSKKKNRRQKVMEQTSNYSVTARNLPNSDLRGVISGCKDHTIEECFSRKLFGLAAPHFAYVKKVTPGLALFLFNYSDRKLHGIFEAAGHGQLNIDQYAWTDGSVETDYPAQVQINICQRCQALTEDQFYPIIADNYYETMLFWFELDWSQTAKLIDLFSSLSVPYDGLNPRNTPTSEASNSLPQNNAHAHYGQKTWSLSVPYDGLHPHNISANEAGTALPENNAHAPSEQRTWSSLFKDDTSSGMVEKEESLKIVSPHPTSPSSEQSNVGGELNISPSINKRGEWNEVCADEWAEGRNTHPFLEANVEGDLCISPSSNKREERNEVCADEWAEGGNTQRDSCILPSINKRRESPDEWAEGDNTQPSLKAPVHYADGDSTLDQLLIPSRSSDIPSVIANLVQDVAMLKLRQTKQEEKIWTLEKELVQSREEFQKLRNEQQFEGVNFEPLNCTHKMNDYILLVGGFDGPTCLPAMSSYCPLHDRMKSLSPNTFQRTCFAVANLNSEVYIFGGMYGNMWYDTVVAYNPRTNGVNNLHLIGRKEVSMLRKKGSLAGASLYALGGFDGS